MFLHHLNNQREASLAKEVVKIQTDLGLPGIVKDCQDFLVRFGLNDITQYSKLQFKRVVKSKIKELKKQNF